MMDREMKPEGEREPVCGWESDSRRNRRTGIGLGDGGFRTVSYSIRSEVLMNDVCPAVSLADRTQGNPITITDHPCSCSVPDDLRAWLGEDELVQVVLHVVATLDLSSLSPHGTSAAGIDIDIGIGGGTRTGNGISERPASVSLSPSGSSGTSLLSVVLYAYTTGRFGSDEIEHACEEDPVLRYLCARNCPTWEVIRRFRRANRALLGLALLELFKSALEARDDSMNALFEGQEVPVNHNYGFPATIPVSVLVAASEDRLQRAVFADSIARDI